MCRCQGTERQKWPLNVPADMQVRKLVSLTPPGGCLCDGDTTDCTLSPGTEGKYEETGEKKNCRREQSTGWSCSVLGQTHFLLHLPCFCSLSKTCVYILTCKCVYINTHYPLNPIPNRLPSLHLLLELHCFPQRWCRLLESKLKNCLNGAI